MNRISVRGWRFRIALRLSLSEIVFRVQSYRLALSLRFTPLDPQFTLPASRPINKLKVLSQFSKPKHERHYPPYDFPSKIFTASMATWMASSMPFFLSRKG